MSNWVAPTNWYWLVQDSSPSTQVWKGTTGAFVALSDADYVAFLAAGNLATVIYTFVDLCGVIDAYNQQQVLLNQGENVINSAVDVTLSNPITSFQNVTMTAAGKAVIMPQANLFDGPAIGHPIIFANNGNNAFDIRFNTGGGTIATCPSRGTTIIILQTNNTANGTFASPTIPPIVNPIATGNIVVDQGPGPTLPIGYKSVAMSGDATLAVSGALTLASTIAAGGPTGDASHVAQITYDAKGRLTAVSSVAITGTPPGGSAGGDLSGTYPNPSLANIPNDTTMAGDVLATNSAAPSSPASGKTRIYVDSTSKNIASKNDAGTVNHGVQTQAGSTHNWIKAIADDGSSTLAQPASTDLSDFTDWTSWTPTWTGSGNSAAVTMTSVSAQYMRLKNGVWFVLNGTISSIGTATGTLQFTLPTTPNAAGLVPGYEAALTGKTIQGRVSSGSATVPVNFYDNTNMLTNGDVPVITGFYKTS